VKIVNILLSNKVGGVEDAFVTHCKILKSHCQELHEILAIVKKDAPYISDLKDENIGVSEIDNKFGYYDLFAINNIRKLINRFQADIVFAHVGKGVLFAHKAIKNHGIPLIGVNHSNNVKRSLGADKILCVNDYINEKIVTLGKKKEDVLTIPNVIDFTENEIEQIKQKTIDSSKPIRIGVMCNLIKDKGVDKLLEVIKFCKDCKDNLILIIAGEGEEKENLINLAKDLGIENNVNFLGWVQDKAAFFNAIDIFVLPSMNESFGIVVIESMKYKVPVVVSDSDGPATIIKNGHNGIIVTREPLDEMPIKIYEAIQDIVNKPDLANKMVTNATQDLINKYSYQNLANIFDEIFEELNIVSDAA
jgi:glycosyltransferase involved in cell wall biosynthesis